MNTRQLFLFFRAHHSMAFGILLSILLIFPVVSAAQAPEPLVVQCTQTFSDCAIPENVQLQFPFLSISGDVVLAPTLHSNLSSVSDVFRLDNNFFL